MTGRSLRTCGAGLLLYVAVQGAAARVDPYFGADDAVPDVQPLTIARQFIAAVERGGLSLFGRPLARELVRARRVEYLYDLKTGAAVRQVYAELLQPFTVPGTTSCEVRGVSVVVDALGGIGDTEAHVWCEGSAPE